MDFVPNFNNRETYKSYENGLKHYKSSDEFAVTKNGGHLVKMHWIFAIVARAFSCLFQISFDKLEKVDPAVNKFLDLGKTKTQLSKARALIGPEAANRNSDKAKALRQEAKNLLQAAAAFTGK